MKLRLIQIYRIGVLLGIIWMLRGQHQWMEAQRDAVEVGLEEVRGYFPEAQGLGSVDPARGGRIILGDGGEGIGYLVQTSPASDGIIGYSGPTNVLLAFGSDNRVRGAHVLRSGDTPDHLAAVVKDELFWEGFVGKRWEEAGSVPEVDTVSGATLTSLAILEGITKRLSGKRPNLRFPEPIHLDEVQKVLPGAAGLEPDRSWPLSSRVVDAEGREIGLVFRTAPFAEEILGYQGPIDVMVALDDTRERVVAVRIRSSYDNPEYVGDVKVDAHFFKKFADASVAVFSEEDLADLGIEGVSGATMTSVALAESVQAGLKALQSANEKADAGSFTAGWMPRDRGDLMMGAVVLLAVLMAFTSLRKRRLWRRVYQVFLIVYVGFLSGDMLAQALLLGWGQSGVAWSTAQGLVLLTAAAFLLPAVTGRQVYCHHICPHGAAQQLLRKWAPKRWRWTIPHGMAHRVERIIPAALLGWVLIVGMLGLGFDLAGIEPFDAYIFRAAGWATIGVFAISLVFSFFVPMGYCRFGCPTGRLLEFVRYRRGGEHFGRREIAGGVFLIVAVALYLGREMIFR